MKILLVDANAVGYSAQQARSLSTAAGEPTQAIFHAIKAMWNLQKRYKGFTPLVLWDSHARWRYDLLPDYKGKRDTYPKQIAMREEYRTQRPYIQEAFRLLGITQVQHEGYEADDIAGVYARKVTSMNDAQAVLYTGDKDWLQLVSEHVTWHDIATDKRVSITNFERHTGFANPIAFLQAKALHGDGSDNIAGVGGIGEKTADKLMQHFGSVKQLLLTHRAHGDFEKGYFADESLNRARNKINNFCANTAQQHALFKRNLKLMNLHAIEPPTAGFFRHRVPADIDTFVAFCMRWEMSSLAAKAELIVNDFEDIT
jgi:DNA polymerase I